MAEPITFLEFFAGGGMARLGLGSRWRCLFANDFDAGKRAAYGANFGLDHHCGDDIHRLGVDDLPRQAADLAWASSPCQDLSLAGARGGLSAARSGAFFGFWRLIDALHEARRAPRMIVVENVTGLLTSHGGADFCAVVERMTARGYVVSALALNASDFVPQSRPRLFIVASLADAIGSARLTTPDPPSALIRAAGRLSPSAKARWRWIDARPSPSRNAALGDLLEAGTPFDPPARTRARVQAMAPHQRAALQALIETGERHAGAGFRRVRIENGKKHVRFEARFDGVAGCIRTPAGGSSRQAVVVIDQGRVQTRLMTPREAARAMGLPEEYRLPERATAALKLIGDGVCPPVVGWLADNILEPALAASRAAA